MGRIFDAIATIFSEPDEPEQAKPEPDPENRILYERDHKCRPDRNYPDGGRGVLRGRSLTTAELDALDPDALKAKYAYPRQEIIYVEAEWFYGKWNLRVSYRYNFAEDHYNCQCDACVSARQQTDTSRHLGDARGPHGKQALTMPLDEYDLETRYIEWQQKNEKGDRQC